jgi:hypothetical protein
MVDFGDAAAASGFALGFAAARRVLAFSFGDCLAAGFCLAAFAAGAAGRAPRFAAAGGGGGAAAQAPR